MTGIRPPKLQNGDRKWSTSKIDSPNGKTTPSWDSDYRNSGDPTPVPQYLLCSEKNILFGKKHRMVRFVHTNLMPSPALIAPAVHAHEPLLTPLDPDGDHTIVEEKTPAPAVKPFVYQDIFETAGPDTTKYRKISSDYVSTIEVDGKKILKVAPEGLTYSLPVCAHIQLPRRDLHERGVPLPPHRASGEARPDHERS